MATTQQDPPENRLGLVLGRWRFPFYYGWAIIGVIFMAQFVASGMGGTTLGIFFKPISDDLGWSLTMLTGAVTAGSIANMVIGPLVGPILDRVGPRPVMLAGTIVAGIGLIALTSVREIWQFWVMYALVVALGLGELGHFTGPVVVSKWFIKKRGRAMAFATTGVAVGGVVLSPIIGTLLGAVGWRQTWLIMGILTMVIMMPLILIFMRRRPEDLGLLPDGAPSLSPIDVTSGKKPAAGDPEVSWTLKEAFRTRSFWLLIFTLNLVSLSASAGLLHLVPFLTKQLGMSTQAASFVLSARLASSSVGRIFLGFLLERIPVRYGLALVVGMRSLGTILLLVLPYPINIPIHIITGGMIGGNLVLVQPLLFSSYYGRKFAGSIQGSIQPLLGIAGLIGPLAIAIMYDVTGTFTSAFYISAAFGFVGCALAMVATPPVKALANAQANTP